MASLIAGAAWWIQPSTRPTERGPQPAPVSSAVAVPQEKGELGHVPPPRVALDSLSSDPGFARWLQEAGLVERVVAAVAAVAEGNSPREPLSFLAPQGAFTVSERKTGTFISPASHARYDGVTRVFCSLDAQAVAGVYATLRPSLSATFATLARPGARFDQALQSSIQSMLEVPVVRGEVEVVPRGAVWAYKDASLEALNPAQKHLLRMGPQNVARIQDKLRELSSALELKLARR
ncbi:DUF3014 domain-containing protein [Hyalangium rubrum]|uniref:DUF3014 domain-containing protein n=1 Tax=Hyalangium rubrum TaxID=3103134 RepID=A0ABU5GUN7_9BACT|nr:DUF3014 domain-containing protein [Hyalangium sp. s54d21]MDY7224898.1 DUF3014 domain-containing protein [Hyalangium sp. s54d21]